VKRCEERLAALLEDDGCAEDALREAVFSLKRAVDTVRSVTSEIKTEGKPAP
jgi:hypothetical protein